MRRRTLDVVTVALSIALITLCILAASGCDALPDTAGVTREDPFGIPSSVEDPSRETFAPNPVNLVEIPLDRPPQPPGTGAR